MADYFQNPSWLCAISNNCEAIILEYSELSNDEIISFLSGFGYLSNL